MYLQSMAISPMNAWCSRIVVSSLLRRSSYALHSCTTRTVYSSRLPISVVLSRSIPPPAGPARRSSRISSSTSSLAVCRTQETQEDYVALPECIQDIIRLIGYLQAMYYSSEPVTDAAVAFHFMAAAVAHLIHVTIAFIPNKDKTSISLLSSSEAKTKEKPCAENLYSISRLTTQPLCHKHLKVPLFYILEEYFEREFIKNQEVAAKLHRKAVLEGICLIEQTTLACSFLTGMRSFWSAGLLCPPAPATQVCASSRLL
ncbi:hypothetical protein J8273_5262 [Carpediemonas membranifera]|uniref:Uncharacterized protein n=1 Tax=Carpediemonas membranifera TaxID=201153 RepID=A0A8J6DYI0_9EUKA|nr:hypothetical protein J8273_5262 [Carpediemonas membranifera]|eukprot:KAG9392274.1 hypothetical protein J8273_5262 [Carpediemonas membranifera]